jgi:hypothetical protein
VDGLTLWQLFNTVPDINLRVIELAPCAAGGAMDETKKRRVLGFLLFTVMTGLLFGIFYGAYHGPWDPRLRRRLEERYQAPPTPPPPAVQGDRVTLFRGQPVTVGKNKLVFYGIEAGFLLLSVYLLELDPATAYNHRIPEKTARAGFTLGGQNFVLTRQSDETVQLRMPEKP